MPLESRQNSIVENGGADEFRVIHLRGEWVRARKRLANHSAREKGNLSASQIKRIIRICELFLFESFSQKIFGQ